MKCALKAEEHTAQVHQGCRCPFQKVPDRRVQISETKDGDGQEDERLTLDRTPALTKVSVQI